MAALHLGNEGYSSDGVNGRVGIGTASPDFQLVVVGGIGTGWGNAAIQASSNSSEAGVSLNNNGTGGRQYALYSSNNSSGLGGGKFTIADVNAQAARILIDSSGKVGINCTDPKGKLDVNDDRIRIRVTNTPSGTGDSSGNSGDHCWDSNYLYVKTGSGWKRAALSTF
jgi:hypothetical protein